jgi:Paired amphipathic helix repeat
VPAENGSSNEIPAVPAASNGSNNNRPLNVTDALSYLDAVKVQFHDKPDVYNNFLDIMKDFKSQMYVLPTIFPLSPLRFFLFGSPWVEASYILDCERCRCIILGLLVALFFLRIQKGKNGARLCPARSWYSWWAALASLIMTAWRRCRAACAIMELPFTEGSILIASWSLSVPEGTDMYVWSRIDTPGVIERVSSLFHGNPYLIEGFNTFLPPGYHINASADPRHPNRITVITPLGTMTSKIGAGTQSAGGSYFGSPLPFGPTAAGSRPGSPLARLQPPQTFSPAPQGLTTAVASVLGNMGNKTQVERAPAAEFDHAILYLNKIKTRYPDDQNNTYKQFLEILQTYRKEQQTSLKDPIGYQQREQRMMHDVCTLSYSELKEISPFLVQPRKRRSLLS